MSELAPQGSVVVHINTNPFDLALPEALEESGGSSYLLGAHVLLLLWRQVRNLSAEGSKKSGLRTSGVKLVNARLGSGALPEKVLPWFGV